MSRFTGRSPRGVDFGLVQLEPGADPAAVKRELQSILPPDVKVFTREEINASESRYWLRLTSVGQLLFVAVVLAVVVGVIFVYQMMVADIKKRLPEYATLRAMGYKFGYLFRVVVWQAVNPAARPAVRGSSRASRYSSSWPCRRLISSNVSWS